MQTDVMKLFCDVAQHHSVSRAAVISGVTQSAASQRIMALEKELSVQLIDRTKRPLQLTAAGEIYFRGCRKLLEAYEKLTRQITQPAEVVRGELRIAAIYSAGIDLLNQVQAKFEEDYPHARVLISYLHPDEVYHRVRNDQCDMGILSFAQRWRDMMATPLRDEVMVLVCPTSHPLAHYETISPSELSGYEMVMFDANLPVHRRIKAYLRRHGVAVQIEHTFDNIDTIKTYIAQTQTVAILPHRTVQREVEQGLLAAVELRPALTRPISVVVHRGRDLPPLVSSFINYLLKHQPAPRLVAANLAKATATVTA
jgi:DNA-binding transcriptional LysR family regulator